MVLFAAESEAEANQWMAALRDAIESLALSSDSPSSTVWPAAPSRRKIFSPAPNYFSSDSSLLEMLQGDRSKLFRSVECLEGDQLTSQRLLVRIDGLYNYGGDPASGTEYFVMLRLYYAGHNVVSPLQSPVSRVPVWDRWLVFADPISSVPPEAMVMVSAYCVRSEHRGLFAALMGSVSEGVTECLGHVHVPITSYGVLRSGSLELPLWPNEGSPFHFHFAAPELLASRPFVRLSFADPPFPVVFDSFLQPDAAPVRAPPPLAVTPASTLPGLPNPLLLQPWADRVALWNRRDTLPSLAWLPSALSGADWTDPAARFEARRVAESAPERSLSCATVLHLVSGEFSASPVRALAARGVLLLSDDELSYVLPVLVAAVRFEPFDYSLLAECLVARALRSRLLHQLFWTLVSQSVVANQAARFRLLRRALQGAMDNAEAAVFVQEAQLAEALCRAASDERRRKVPVATLLKPFERFGQSVRLPLAPQFVVEGLQLERCKVLTSNAAPLLLRFAAVDNAPAVICKAGDDLRQDEFALLFGNLLNRVWFAAGLRARVITYRVTGVLDNVGMIELVDGCKSVGAIQGGVAGALTKNVVGTHLRGTVSSSNTWDMVMDQFVSTLAGACVFEFLLGIGDRHSDNILMRGPEIFHIDFAYLFGNKTYFGAIPREVQPFTFSPAYLDALGGLDSPHYAAFLRLSEDAYNAVRREHVLLTTVCMVALGQEMPHLRSNENLHGLRDAFALDLSEADAAALWRSKVGEALSSTRQQMNDAVHNLVQSLKSSKK